MLATPAAAEQLPDDPSAWAYEVKWDGMRVLAGARGPGRPGRVRLSSRTGNDVTAAFAELADAWPGLEPGLEPGLGPGAGPGAGPGGDGGSERGLPPESPVDLVLDGEVVVLHDGLPSFAALADRMHVLEPRRARALARAAPATFIAFDLLRLGGHDLTGVPWQQRRELLERLPLPVPGWQLSPVYDDRDALIAATLEQGLEGVLAKRRAAIYQPGVRSRDWVKLAHRRVQTCLVGGWRPEVNTSGRLGALLLGIWDHDATGGRVLRFAGRVGSGLAGGVGDAVGRLLEPLRADRAPFASALPRADADGAVWVRPEVVVDVEYKGRTEGGRLREPVFRGLRADVPPEAVRPE